MVQCISIPFPKICTSHNSRTLNVPGNVIFSEVPMAYGSHMNDFVSSFDIVLLFDPHVLYVPLNGPTMMVKCRRLSPGAKGMCLYEVIRYNANTIIRVYPYSSYKPSPK